MDAQQPLPQLDDDDEPCFPSDAVVLLDNGATARVDSLEVGARILAAQARAAAETFRSKTDYNEIFLSAVASLLPHSQWFDQGAPPLSKIMIKADAPSSACSACLLSVMQLPRLHHSPTTLVQPLPFLLLAKTQIAPLSTHSHT